MHRMEPTGDQFEQNPNRENPLSPSEPRLPNASLDSIGEEFIKSQNLRECSSSLSGILRHPNFSWSALTEFVNIRANRMASTTPISDFSAGNFVGFFNPETLIRGSNWSLPLKLNDPKFFTESFISSCQRYLATNSSEKGVRVQSPLIAGGAVARYFNSPLHYDPKSERALKFSIDADIGLHAFINLADIKGKSWADTMERSPLYSQAMSFLGFDVTTCFGLISTAESNGVEEHMFSVIKTDKGYSIYDIGHPVVWNHLDGHQQVYAAIFPVRDYQLNEFLRGKPVAFNHSEFNQLADSSFMSRTITRIYRLNSKMQ